MSTNPLIGRWRLQANPDFANPNDWSMEFTQFGDLVYTIFDGNRIKGRILLVYRLDGNFLITDQPSAPREEIFPFLIDGDTLFLGDGPSQSVLIREKPDHPSDQDAYMFAIGSAAIKHGLDSVHVRDQEPFVPFLITDSSLRRSLTRFVTVSPEDARRQARLQWSSQQDSPKACAYAADGYVTLGENRLDAVLVEVSQSGQSNGFLLAQAYVREHRRVSRAGPITIQEHEPWG